MTTNFLQPASTAINHILTLVGHGASGRRERLCEDMNTRWTAPTHAHGNLWGTM
jgi:hypothetical protein